MSLEERRAQGGQARNQVPLASHSGWRPAPDRAGPVALPEAQNLTREPDLVPVRHGRMMVSPFTFYRGAAKIMASDLNGTPTAGLDVQLCGDAHLSNFGVYASPERTLVFDLNEFDETLPGPFGYDVKRMAAGFTIAGRNNGFSAADTRAATYYWRQLRDMKGSSDIESMLPAALTFYAGICGWPLARAHARSGDPAAITGYLGGTDTFDQAVTDFSLRYADQNEHDFQDFIKAIHPGRLEAREGLRARGAAAAAEIPHAARTRFLLCSLFLIGAESLVSGRSVT